MLPCFLSGTLCLPCSEEKKGQCAAISCCPWMNFRCQISLAAVLIEKKKWEPWQTILFFLPIRYHVKFSRGAQPWPLLTSQKSESLKNSPPCQIRAAPSVICPTMQKIWMYWWTFLAAARWESWWLCGTALRAGGSWGHGTGTSRGSWGSRTLILAPKRLWILQVQQSRSVCPNPEVRMT